MEVFLIRIDQKTGAWEEPGKEKKVLAIQNLLTKKGFFSFSFLVMNAEEKRLNVLYLKDPNPVKIAFHIKKGVHITPGRVCARFFFFLVSYTYYHHIVLKNEDHQEGKKNNA